MRIAVLGAGAWGTALAAAAAPQHEVLLWARDDDQVSALAASRCNRRYLPELTLPPALRLSADLQQSIAHAEGGLLIIATPTAGLRGLLAALPRARPALWLSKGFEAGSGSLGHEIARELRPQAPVGVLSGPSFALEVARGQPTALVVASADDTLARTAVQALHGGPLRIYTSSDVIGVEVGGALKNVLAIAAGMLDGLTQHAAAASAAPGLNARAALITRGLAEMTRLGVALGASAETFMGLSGLGDLVLTTTGDLSRNRRVGLLLAEGLPLDAVLERLGHVAEGVFTARVAVDRAARLGVQMPISEAVVAALEGRLAPREAMQSLMARDARAET